MTRRRFDEGDWEAWGIASYSGGFLRSLLGVGAPTLAGGPGGSLAPGCRPAVEADESAYTLRWCGLVLQAFRTDQEGERALRAVLADPDLLAALLAALQLGGADAGERFLRGALG